MVLFRLCFTQAHRIETIMDSNRVMVMEKGVAIEFDSPDKLMKQPTSAFRSLALSMMRKGEKMSS